MGTPHSGSPIASLGQTLANIASIFGQTDDRLLKHLTLNSEFLQQQLDQYKNISSEYRTLFVYETLQIRTPKGMVMVMFSYAPLLLFLTDLQVVPFENAVVQGVRDVGQYGISANHSDLAKFASKDSHGYRYVSRTLRSWKGVAGDRIKEHWEAEERREKGTPV